MANATGSSSAVAVAASPQRTASEDSIDLTKVNIAALTAKQLRQITVEAKKNCGASECRQLDELYLALALGADSGATTTAHQQVMSGKVKRGNKKEDKDGPYFQDGVRTLKDVPKYSIMPNLGAVGEEMKPGPMEMCDNFDPKGNIRRPWMQMFGIDDSWPFPRKPLCKVLFLQVPKTR